MPSVHRTSQAELDLAELANHIARKNLDAALRFLDSAEATFQTLGKSPELGFLGEFRSKHLQRVRRWRVEGFENYLIFYRSVTDGIEVVRVLHGARDIEAVFGEGTS